MQGKSLAILKRLFVALIGLALLAIGIAMIVLPGSAIVIIPLAFACWRANSPGRGIC